ncbi:ABC1 family protein [Ancylostoma ceylanicum]|uniref:ABC1 family protein n=1 Tax=Ancylostoma ceylanicum TaxID=53326 RepID=A0A0D6M6Y6_9BILA|nr:ABC1 family protein [Ancylostoma ceylanicum]
MERKESTASSTPIMHMSTETMFLQKPILEKRSIVINFVYFPWYLLCGSWVYKATVNVPALERATGRRFPQLEGHVEREIAIKVAERGVEEKINLDLSILRNGASLMVKIMPSLGYLEPLAALAQFEMVLRRQVDLRNEARALQKFSENFDHKKTGIKFPIVIGYTKNAIIETFEHGMYINRLVSEENDPQLAARQSPRVRRRIALLGARALLKMIFVDNFVHGDLHPGNILIR